MTDEQERYLDEILADLISLPLSPEQKAQIIRDEADKLNDPVSSDQVTDYLRRHGLLAE